MSHFDRTVNLCQRGENTVLVKKPGVHIDQDVSNEHVKVEIMETVIVKYCKIYTEDLSERLGLNEAHLPNAMSFPALLNTMFGNKS